jgi:hypothetical protein
MVDTNNANVTTGLTSGLQPWYMRPMPGMSNKLENLEQDANYVELAQNCRFEGEPGTVYKREPITYYNTVSMGTGAVMGIYRFYRSDGTIKLLAVHNTSVYVGTDASGTMTALTLPAGFTLTTGKRMAFTTYKDLCIMSNGTDNIIVYDGSSDNVCWELGSCKAKVVTGAGAITRTVLSYAVTMDNDAYVCGAVSNQIATVTAQNIDLSNIPLGPSGTVNRKIYRKSSETGGSYKLLTTIANNTATTYTDNNNDVSGGAVMPAVTDDFPKGNILKINRERLFIAGDPNKPNRAYYSNAYLPGYIQQTTNLDYMDITPEDGDEISGLVIQSGIFICIKKNSIRKIYTTASGRSEAASDIGSSPKSWYCDDRLIPTGCPAQWSIVETKYGVLFLGWDHWYQFDGNALTPIIDEFDTDSILATSYYDIVANFAKDALQWIYVNAEDANNYADTVGRYDFFRKKFSIDKYNTAQGTTGINCFTSYSGDDESGDVYYGDSRNGFVYRAENTPQWVRWNKKSQLDLGTLTDIFVWGTEDDPWFEIGWTTTIDQLTTAYVTPTAVEDTWSALTTYQLGDACLSGGVKYVCTAVHINKVPPDAGFWAVTATALSIDKLPGTINMPNTDGTIVFPSMELNAGTLLKVFWNATKFVNSDTVSWYFRSGVDQATCEAAAWGTAHTLSGMDILTTANIWVQVKCELTANSTDGSPRVYYSDGYVLKFSYRIGGSIADQTVEFDYNTGNRNFQQPFVDKIHKKIIVVHQADITDGTYTLYWETENSNNSFTVDLSTNNKRWESYFHDTAMGRDLSIRIYKNDLLDLKIKEMMGVFTPEPIVI